MMRRRDFIKLVAGSPAAWPLAAHAQQADIRRIGVFMGIESDPDAHTRVAAFRQALSELGWSEDRNTTIDVIWGAGDPLTRRRIEIALHVIA